MTLLLASILVPLAAIPLQAVARGWKKGGVAVCAALLASTALLALAGASACRGAVLVENYPLEPRLGLVMLRGDGFNVAYALTASLVCALTAVYAGSFMAHRRNPEAFYALYSTAASALVGVALSDSLTSFFVFLEFFLIPSWLLILYWGEAEAREAAFKYLIFTEVGALITMLGIAFVYDRYGTLAFTVLESAVREAPAGEKVVAALLLAAAPLVKMGVVPLHPWLPGAYTEAPSPVSVELAVATGMGSWALAKVLSAFNPWTPQLAASLVGLAALTMVYGGLAALAQRDFKLLLAYSSVSQSGYMVMALACGRSAALPALAIMYAAHSLSKASLFAIAGYVEKQCKTRIVDRMGGLAGTMPLTATAALAAFLSLAGVPPTLGFWGELALLYWVFSEGVLLGLTGLTAATAVAVATALTAAYGLWTFKRVFHGRTRRLVIEDARSALVLIPLIFAALLVLLGIAPQLLADLVTAT